jgi:tRNA (guanine37-N1)-methyltransferase
MTLKRRLKGIVPDMLIRDIPTSYEVIGNIAIVPIPPSCDAYKQDIALAVLSMRRNIRTVLSPVSAREGDERVPRFETLIGTSTVTEHHEFGFRYRLDVARVFFNPRLATERQRIFSKLEPGEEILVPFAGVGPFVIPAAARGTVVTAIEKNPEAAAWLRGNLTLNGVEGRVRVIEGDAWRILEGLSPGFDRAICPTPYGMDAVLPLVASRVKSGGIIHFYTFQNDRQAEDLALRFPQEGLDVLLSRGCGQVAPGVNRYVFDLLKKSEQMNPYPVKPSSDLPDDPAPGYGLVDR